MEKFILLLLAVCFFRGASSAFDELAPAVTRLHQFGGTKFATIQTFMPDSPIRRDEATKIFMAYTKQFLGHISNTGQRECQFTDLADARLDLHTSIVASCQAGLFFGHNGLFMPQARLRNDEIATVIHRIMRISTPSSMASDDTSFYQQMQSWGLVPAGTGFFGQDHSVRTTRGELAVTLFRLAHVGTIHEHTGPFYQVTKVIDGDTIEVALSGKTEKIRLLGIDTPETVDPKTGVECFGPDASQKMSALLSGTYVYLTGDNTQTDKDKYNRLLRYVYTDQGVFINERLVRNGYATEYTYKTPYLLQTAFQTAERFARDEHIGVWAESICSGEQQKSVFGISGHIFYTSTHFTSKLYYCDTDVAWETLSSKYLRSYADEATLQADYPTKTLHEPCKETL